MRPEKQTPPRNERDGVSGQCGGDQGGDTPDLRRAALSYADRGWKVFPIYPPTFIVDEGGIRAVCSCRKGAACPNVGKHPRTNWKLGEGTALWDQPASDEPEMVAAWWGAWPDSNIGIRTGAVSGIFVVDVDKRAGGWDTLGRLDAEHGWNYDTARVLTPSGGGHFYYLHPGVPVKTDAGKVLGPGVDIRGEDGVAVAPPSLHKNGGRYMWQYDVGPTGPREPTNG